MQTETFYNTTGLTGLELKQAAEDTKKQNAVILTIFRECAADKYVSPHYVKAVLDARTSKEALITSVRRAITTLCQQGVLTKSDKASLMGAYGVRCYGWRLAN